jgi:hypothetical protein
VPVSLPIGSMPVFSLWRRKGQSLRLEVDRASIPAPLPTVCFWAKRQFSELREMLLTHTVVRIKVSRACMCSSGSGKKEECMQSVDLV